MTTTEFETLLSLHGDSIYGFCCHITGSRQSADDLYQDSMLKALELLPRIDGSSAKGLKSAKNYIIGIAVKLYSNQRRKKSNNVCFIEDSYANSLRDNIDIPTDTEMKSQQNAVRTAVANLPEKLRSVTYMFYYADMGIADIASQLSIPEGTVKSRLNHARKAIKKELEENGYE